MRHPLLWLIAGFGLWSVAFFVLYATQATGCHLSEGSVSTWRILLIAIFTASVGASVFLALQLRRKPRDGFIRHVAFRATLAATVSIVLCFSGIFWLSFCR
ncbi:hypothetical protein [Limoniibacter endophyticus]|uniref:Uncharacterized protein n=1 Tax=Limoniibacter endophyticus TaxID=1565040 RepID=A0A8J3DHL2_9HYPH|nr:hypothetical protein [Limoniibacter endophyticus]GHC72460.1 hypothetical protein GCM10010136_20180 [Limoniibacter endophyticus]